MSAPQPPTDPDPRRDTAAAVAQPPSDSPPAQPPAPRKRPWGWIAVAGLLAAGVVGLAIYAVNLNSDLDDANAQIASQQEQIDQTQNTGADVVAAAKGAYDDLSAQLGAAQEDASQAAEEAAARLDQAEQAAAEAQGTAEEVQKQADAAQAKAEAAATCAQSFLSAFSGVFSGATLREGVEATVTELQALQPQCATALSGSGA
jgi:uncharacterized membrane-anchored protein YhcB (DUF1043 family)